MEEHISKEEYKRIVLEKLRKWQSEENYNHCLKYADGVIDNDYPCYLKDLHWDKDAMTLETYTNACTEASAYCLSMF